MKHSFLTATLLSFALTILNNNAFAASNFSDPFYCNALCMSIDMQTRTANNIGQVEGSSQISTHEAFAIMKQDCVNKANATGQDPTKVYLIDGDIKMKKVDQNSQASSIAFQPGIVSRIFGQQITGLSSNSAGSTEFEFEIQRANLKSCEKIEVNPNGEPKYIGSGNPLG